MDSRRRAGIVLAGGYSTRYGDQEKALAELDGRALLAHAVRGVAPAVEGVIVNCRRDQLAEFRRVLRTVPTDIAFVCDPEPDEGPAAGLATALGAVRTSSVAVVACDMPFVDARFWEWLFGELADAEGAVPYVDGAPQPTHAVFATKPTRRAANEAHDHASGSLREVLDKLDIVEIPEARVLDRTEKASFIDVNTHTELETVSSTSDSGSLHRD